MSTLIFCSPKQLKTHPQNMRRFYPEADVQAMARSIAAAGGVVEALKVVANGTAQSYLVVDGNMRLAGGRLLGDECPPLKCEVITASHAEQLLLMVTTSKLHFPKDPISEGLHYRRLLGEGYGAAEISARTGVGQKTVENRLRLLDLDEPIQELIAQDLLPRDRRIADALLAIPDESARVKLAQRLARPGVTVKAILAAAARLQERLQTERAAQATGAPALALAGQLPTSAHRRPKWKGVRVAAQAMCTQCEVKAGLPGVAEPAWQLVLEAAAETCDGCSLKGDVDICRQCRGVELLKRLVASAREA